jgi:hypothetical protein
VTGYRELGYLLYYIAISAMGVCSNPHSKAALCIGGIVPLDRGFGPLRIKYALHWRNSLISSYGFCLFTLIHWKWAVLPRRI